MDARGYDRNRGARPESGASGARHAGRPGPSGDPTSSDAPSGDWLLGRDGKPLLDRYGNPVRRRVRSRPQGSADAADRSRYDFDRYERRRPLRRRPAPHEETRTMGSRTEGGVGAAGAGAGAIGIAAGRGMTGSAREGSRPRQHFPQETEAPEYAPQQPWRYPPGPGFAEKEWSDPRPAPIRRSRPAPRRRRRLGCGGCAGIVVAAVLVLALLAVLWADVRLDRVNALPENQVPKTSGTNWLLIGSDSRQGLTEEDIERLGTGGDIGTGRTDTIMLLHIPRSGKASLVSLPRDSYLPVPGYGYDKLNAAFTYGGPQLITTTVEQATGLHIDHYAEIGMGGLAHVVDAVGGVEVCPEDPIQDPLANLDIGAGCQRVDGPTALGYVRTRATPLSDLDRVARQREFFAALLDEVASPATMLNPLRLVPLIHSTAGSFTVGENTHVWHLARIALAMRSGITMSTVPVGGFADYDVGNVVLWDEAGAAQLWDSLS